MQLPLELFKIFCSCYVIVPMYLLYLKSALPGAMLKTCNNVQQMKTYFDLI